MGVELAELAILNSLIELETPQDWNCPSNHICADHTWLTELTNSDQARPGVSVLRISVKAK